MPSSFSGRVCWAPKKDWADAGIGEKQVVFVPWLSRVLWWHCLAWEAVECPAACHEECWHHSKLSLCLLASPSLTNEASWFEDVSDTVAIDHGTKPSNYRSIEYRTRRLASCCSSGPQYLETHWVRNNFKDLSNCTISSPARDKSPTTVYATDFDSWWTHRQISTQATIFQSHLTSWPWP